MSASAERDSSIQSSLALLRVRLLERVTNLDWIRPQTSTFVALAREPLETLWDRLRFDPAALVVLLRANSEHLLPSASLPSTLRNVDILDTALRLLEAGSSLSLDRSHSSIERLSEAGTLIASLAESIARRTGVVDPECAWMAGMLAPLGWYAIGALEPDSVDALLEGEARNTEPESFAHLLTRRVLRCWQLPAWLESVLMYYPLSGRVVQEMGADVDLVQHVQLAVELCREAGIDLHLVDPEWAREAGASLGLSRDELRDIREETVARQQPLPEEASLEERPLLLDLLRLALDNCKFRDGRGRERLETENDRLHRTLENQVRSETERVRADRLAGLAELAAGAGHEINNPLAVISGQAQYLLGHAQEWFTEEGCENVRSSLQGIIGQTQRIHTLLRDLIQFARPSSPKLDSSDLPTLLGEVTSACGEFAAREQVALELVCVPDRFALVMDADQIRKALTCLVRNAIEAAPKEGYVRIHLPPPEEGASTLDIIVEDSGPGPSREQERHLFDPFYSGRQAGRGKGMGLPIAWRLARLHGGEVRMEPSLTEGPTRFVLSLPRVHESSNDSENAPDRISAPPTLKITRSQPSSATGS